MHTVKFTRQNVSSFSFCKKYMCLLSGKSEPNLSVISNLGSVGFLSLSFTLATLMHFQIVLEKSFNCVSINCY